MSANSPNRNVFELAIDSAFIRHVGGLFDKFAADLATEADSNPDELRAHSAIPDARKKFRKSFDTAILTHTEMMNVLRQS